MKKIIEQFCSELNAADLIKIDNEKQIYLKIEESFLIENGLEIIAQAYDHDKEFIIKINSIFSIENISIGVWIIDYLYHKKEKQSKIEVFKIIPFKIEN